MADLAKTRGRKSFEDFQLGEKVWVDASYFDDLKVNIFLYSGVRVVS